MKRLVTTIAATATLALGLTFAPQAQAATMVQGGPYTGLSADAPSNIHLAFSNYPMTHGIYVLEAVKPEAGMRPTVTNAATQLWLSSDTSGGAKTIKGDVVLVVDNGHSWGADCLHQQCGIFIRLDHTATADTSEDQFIPLTFAASTGSGSTTTSAGSGLTPDVLTVSVNGKVVAPNVPGTIAYRTPLTFSAVTASGKPVTLKSYTPDLCPVTGSAVDALKGAGQCDIAVTSPGDATHGMVTAHFPLNVVPADQTLKITSATLKVGKSIALSATTGFGEKVTYKSTSKSCSVKGSAVKAISAGTCSVSATAPGTTNYSALTTNVVVTVKK
jgi:hypothetical protein